MESLIINCDGSSGHDKRAVSAVVVKGHTGKVLMAFSVVCTEGTSNTAEYVAVLLAIRLVNVIKPREAVVLTDSALVVNQINGRYAIKANHLKKYYDDVLEAMRQAKELGIKVSVQKINRKDNLEADNVAKQINRAMRDMV